MQMVKVNGHQGDLLQFFTSTHCKCVLHSPFSNRKPCSQVVNKKILIAMLKTCTSYHSEEKTTSLNIFLMRLAENAASPFAERFHDGDTKICFGFYFTKFSKVTS
jgi:hypothetical protein